MDSKRLLKMHIISFFCRLKVRESFLFLNLTIGPCSQHFEVGRVTTGQLDIVSQHLGSENGNSGEWILVFFLIDGSLNVPKGLNVSLPF